MDDRRHYRNEHVRSWLRAIMTSDGALLVGAHQQQARGLYHLGAMWARQRGYIEDHGPQEPIGHAPRQYRYTLTDKGKRVARWLYGHKFRYDYFRAGLLCDKCGEFRSDFL